MQCEITLHGKSSLWSFPGSSEFSAWMAKRLWIVEGGICVLRTTSGQATEEFVDAIERAVYGANKADSQLAVVRVECGGESGPPLDGILRGVGSNPGPGKFEAARILARALRDQSKVFVLIPHDEDSSIVWDDVRDLIDICSKEAVGAALCVVVVDDSYKVSIEPSYDFTIGWPQGSNVGDTAREEDYLWASYVHERLAWESGGNLTVAADLDGFTSTIRPGDDETLESQLNERAKENFRSHSRVPLLGEYLSLQVSKSQRGSSDALRAHEDLVSCGLLWEPPHSLVPRVVPWASRALLSLGLFGDSTLTLRGNLVCAPLANSMFTACMHAESRIRMTLEKVEKRYPPSDQTKESFSRFKDGFDNFVLYPHAHPSPPRLDSDIWIFAALGELLTATPQASVSEMYWHLLRLRNLVMHGHYIVWEHIVLINRILQLLSR